MIRSELAREKMRIKTSRKAWNFDTRLKEGKGGAIVRKYLKYIKEKWKRGKKRGNWKKKMKEFLRDRGVKEGKEEEIEYGEIEEKDTKGLGYRREKRGLGDHKEKTKV